MFMAAAALLAASQPDDADSLARQVKANPALMQAIEARAIPIVQCSRRAIEAYIGGRGENAFSGKPEDVLTEAIVAAAHQCVTGDEVAALSSRIQRAIPGADAATADAIAEAALNNYAAIAIMSDSE